MPIFGLISIIFNNSTHPRSPMDVANATNLNKHLKPYNKSQQVLERCFNPSIQHSLNLVSELK